MGSEFDAEDGEGDGVGVEDDAMVGNEKEEEESGWKNCGDAILTELKEREGLEEMTMRFMNSKEKKTITHFRLRAVSIYTRRRTW